MSKRVGDVPDLISRKTNRFTRRLGESVGPRDGLNPLQMKEFLVFPSNQMSLLLLSVRNPVIRLTGVTLYFKLRIIEKQGLCIIMQIVNRD